MHHAYKVAMLYFGNHMIRAQNGKVDNAVLEVTLSPAKLSESRALQEFEEAALAKPGPSLRIDGRQQVAGD
jgi:hypothetical protein